MAFIRIVSTGAVTDIRGKVTKLLIDVEYEGLRFKQYQMEVTCTAPDGTTSIVTKDFFRGVDSLGVEQAEISINDGDLSKCSCNGTITVNVKGFVSSNEEVTDQLTDMLICGCPTLTEKRTTVAENCVGTKRQVSIDIDVQTISTGTIIVKIDWAGNGVLNDTVTIQSSQTVRFQRDMPAGRYTANIQILYPMGCHNLLVFYDVAACDITACPTITAINTPVVEESCNDNLTRTVNLSAVIAGSPLSLLWNFGDGTDSGSIDPAVNPTAFVTHDYPAPGNISDPPSIYRAVLTVVGEPATQCVASKDVDIRVAPCQTPCPAFPAFDSSQFTVNNKSCDDQGRKKVTLSNLDILRATPDTITIDWGDGTVTQPLSPDVDRYEHSYEAGRDYTIMIEARGPGNCQVTMTKDVTIEPCPRPLPEGDKPPAVNDRPKASDGDEKGGLGLGCILLLILALLTSLGGAIAFILGVCAQETVSTIAGAIVGALGGGLLLLWAALCAWLDCSVYQKIRYALEVFIALIALAAILLFIFHDLVCGLAAVITFAYYGTVYMIYIKIGISIGCLIPEHGEEN